ncbi:glycoprotein-N-acetylgalactosamine 3-beta-galactosyltransferase 1-B-like isoform X1 [Littorina saxatilis]|uniref:glycoprotein-N-acetylgalactosamine 3-beta-galactosyltransferase 1-B-like isoform X1 n=1 Tax=Littorina saxatilis TaxID=31220 RepID=UPI0038B5009A
MFPRCLRPTVLVRAIKLLVLVSSGIMFIKLVVLEKCTSSLGSLYYYDQNYTYRGSAVGTTETGPKSPEKVRVLVWIMTGPKNLQSKASVVRETWGRRANQLLFFSSVTNETFPTIGLNTTEGRQHLTAKTVQAFRYIYHHHLDDAEWFMKADDDTYVIMENLRHFLSQKNTSEPVYFGYRFKPFVKQGYNSGGAGYVLSREALRRFGKQGTDPKLCEQDGGDEDVHFGQCMQNLGVRITNSTDSDGHTLFHPFHPETHFFGTYPRRINFYAFRKARKGFEGISKHAISFHYVSPTLMRLLELYLYHIRPYAN